MPPGPALPTWLQTLLWVYLPLPFLSWCERRYGDLYTLRLSFAGDVVCISDPAAIGHVFGGSPSVFRAGDANRAIEVLLGENAPMMIDGERHRQLRRASMSRMRGAQLERHRQLVTRAVLADMASWPVGRPFRLLPHMREVAADIVMGLTLGDTPPARLGHLRRTILKIARLGEHRSTLLPWLRTDIGPVGPWSRFLRLRRSMDSQLFEEIRARRVAGADGGSDLLSGLLELREQDGSPVASEVARDQLVNLIFAGYETTVVAICWCLDLLLHHVEVLARLRESLEAGDEAYLTAVVQETLRLRTVILAVGRRLAEDTRVAGHQLPAGTIVAPNIAQVHRSARIHAQPEVFRPERFLGGEIPHCAWIPFGGGPHRCPGEMFAMFAVKAALRTILLRAALKPASRRPERMTVRAVSTAPGGGVRIVLEGRA